MKMKKTRNQEKETVSDSGTRNRKSRMRRISEYDDDDDDDEDDEEEEEEEGEEEDEIAGHVYVVFHVPSFAWVSLVDAPL